MAAMSAVVEETVVVVVSCRPCAVTSPLSTRPWAPRTAGPSSSVRKSVPIGIVGFEESLVCKSERGERRWRGGGGQVGERVGAVEGRGGARVLRACGLGVLSLYVSSVVRHVDVDS